jgi:hypothetical protein
MPKSVLVCLLCLLTATWTSADRRGRLFSIFNVIRFAQAPCVAATGDCGTCMTATQCMAITGGVPVNHCAAGTCSY